MKTVKMILVGGPRSGDVVEISLQSDGLPDYWFQAPGSLDIGLRQKGVGWYNLRWHATGPVIQRAYYEWHHEKTDWNIIHEVMTKHYPEDQPKDNTQ